jgi:arsenate reductase
MMVDDRKRVLFLCTGNSCRSQMAEAIVNSRMGDQWLAFSAGVEPAGEVNSHALKALAELGIVHIGESKHVDVFKDADFDLVVTVCDDAAENCPLWLGKGVKEHLGFPDPAKARGTQEQIMPVYRQVLKDIARKIPKLLEEKTKIPAM